MKFLLLLLLLFSCGKKQASSEKNMAHIFSELEIQIDADVKSKFKNCSENDLSSSIIREVELVIQNQLDSNSVIKNDLRQRGVSEREMRSLFILSWHRKLNSKPIDFEESIEKIIQHYNLMRKDK